MASSDNEYTVDIRRYGIDNLYAIDEEEIIDLESYQQELKQNRNQGRRKRHSTSDISDDVIIVGSSHTRSAPRPDDEITVLLDSNGDTGSLRRKKKKRISSTSFGSNEVLITKEVRPPVKNPSNRSVKRRRKKSISDAKDDFVHIVTDGRERVSLMRDDSQSEEDPELPGCSFLQDTTKQKQKPSEEISALDLFQSYPRIAIFRTKEEKYNREGTPLYWTSCTNCSDKCTDTYHTFPVIQGAEFENITSAMKTSNFTVTEVYRVQNSILWKRYKGEKSLMKEGTCEGYDVRETWLYHMTTAKVGVICDEGLDPRLSRAGNFGRGTYFSDNPLKCHQYARVSDGNYTMLLCRVLLGDIKEYPQRATDPALTREPPKDNPLPGEKKTYDSVKGNMSGFDEYVIYNPYRVLPEYIIEYISPFSICFRSSRAISKNQARASNPLVGTSQMRPGNQGYNPSYSNSQVFNPPYSSAQGYNPHSGAQGYIPPHPGTQGCNPPHPGTQGYNPPHPGTQGYNPPHPGAQGYLPPHSSLQTYNPPYSNTQGYNNPSTHQVNSAQLPSSYDQPARHLSHVPNINHVSRVKGQLIKLAQDAKKLTLDSLSQ